MNKIDELIQEVSSARASYLKLAGNLNESQAAWKSNADEWSAIEITEHLFWAEQGGILGMWKTIHAIRSGAVARSVESVHRDMRVEQIIELTWKEKELVPAVAAPRLGGPISYWCAMLNSLQEVLVAFGKDLKEDELRLQAHPHPISGPMDFQQRIEFLCFHINRHREQVSRLVNKMNTSV